MNKNSKKNPAVPTTPRGQPEVERRRSQTAQPVLRFSPAAWAKLLCMRDLGPVEVGGFAITAADDLLRAEEFVTVEQRVTAGSVRFEDAAVADFFDRQIDLGRTPSQFMRAWVHTHPGDSACPSSTDEETFARVFGKSDWAVMCILARGGQTYARLRFNIGPGGHIQIPVEVDFRGAFSGSDPSAWQEEYRSNVHPVPAMPGILEPAAFDEFDHQMLQAEQIDPADPGLSWEPF